ncbi:hypothetical protein HC031_31165 [Planosporangium thailandense]|uniref:Uncharacterized protein n=1 Tax=Planosporangium thailandense TaxID=765197 RepID=A0ABX0Y9D8_9ACTN|nr:hypothetical protein [Planosporangium thailandense]NJC74140.1 hypothetical protein [Planosporangium thailandense]
MDVMQVSGAAGARQVNRVDGRHLFKPDSAVVRAALDLLATHVAEAAAGASPRCGQCGRHFPCPTVENARQVVVAGGGLVSVAGQLEQKVTSTLAPVDVQRAPEAAVELGASEAAGEPGAPEAAGDSREQEAAGGTRESEPGVAPVPGGRVGAARVDSISAVPTGLVAKVTHIVTQREPDTAGEAAENGTEKADKKREARDPVGAA